MRPVNLLPPRYRPARASGDRPGVGYAVIGTLAVLLVMVLLFVSTNNGIKDAESKTAAAQAEQQVAQARIGQLQAFGDFASLKVSREAAVRGVAQVRFDYERLMREVALVLPHNTYLTTFAASSGGASAAAATATATAAGPSVTIGGCAPSHPGVATVIVRLRKLHNVVDVDLTSSTKSGAGGAAAPTGGGCTTSFNAVLKFTAETAPTVTEPVPARLGGGQ
jgi:Tfp pilus assembly protein PilN